MNLKYLATASLLLSTYLLAQEKPISRTIERLNFDWNKRGDSEFLIESLRSWTGPGDFTRLRIKVPGEKEFLIYDQDGLVSPFDKDTFVPNKLLKESKRLIKSNYILAINESDKPGSNILIALIGWPYASSPGSLWIIQLAKIGPPYIALHKKEMGLDDITDLDGDGIRELIGYPCLHQALGDKMTTYDPFHVFEFKGAKLQFSLSLTEAYNLKNYVWAGPNCSETIGVKTLSSKKLKLVKIR
jgi:hypothetical protein